MVPGYVAYCQDCENIKRLTYLKDAKKFLCKDCCVRYTKLYVKMNNISH